MTAMTDRRLSLHPGINFSRLEVGGDLGGGLFVLGSVIVLFAGLPQVRWFVLTALAAALPIACLLLAWHRSHQGPPELWRPIDLDLSGSVRHLPSGPRPESRTRPMLQEVTARH